MLFGELFSTVHRVQHMIFKGFKNHGAYRISFSEKSEIFRILSIFKRVIQGFLREFHYCFSFFSFYNDVFFIFRTVTSTDIWAIFWSTTFFWWIKEKKGLIFHECFRKFEDFSSAIVIWSFFRFSRIQETPDILAMWNQFANRFINKNRCSRLHVNNALIRAKINEKKSAI